MDNLNDLKKIWLTADTRGLPNTAEMVRIVKKFRNKKLVKITAVVAAAFFLTVMMVFVMFIYKSTMLTTRLGEVCIVISGLILLCTNLNSLTRFYKFNDFDNTDFLKFLEKTKIRQKFYYKKTQVVSLGLVSIGLVLYLTETAMINSHWTVIVYTFTVVYLLVIWLIVRPRMYKRQSKKMDETIRKYEQLTKQLDGPSADEDL